MEKDAAYLMIAAAYRAMREIGDLAPLVKQTCIGPEYDALRRTIGIIVADIGIKLVDPIYEQHPEIRDEVGMRIEKFSRAF